MLSKTSRYSFLNLILIVVAFSISGISTNADELYWVGIPDDEDDSARGIYTMSLDGEGEMEKILSLEERVRDFTVDSDHVTKRKMYWVVRGPSSLSSEIWTANLDGSDQQLIFEANLYIGSLAIDSRLNHFYLGTNEGVLRLELDQLKLVTLDDGLLISDIELDIDQKRLFMIGPSPFREPGRYRPPTLWTSDTAFEDAEALIELGSLTGDISLSVDPRQQKIYWAAVDYTDCSWVERIQRSNYDLTDSELVFCGGPTLDDFPSRISFSPNTQEVIWHNTEVRPTFSVSLENKNNTELFKVETLDALLVVPTTDKKNFIRGDVNLDKKVEMADAINILQYLFLGENHPQCLAAADVDLSKVVDISDTVNLLSHLFLGGPDIPAPYPDCGLSPFESDKELGCKVFFESCD